jgi:pyruvate formate lyase activating enzyme
MRIGGLVRSSLIDWEGLNAVIFLKGCNLRCGFCHNPQLVLPCLIDSQPDIPEADILRYLEQRRGWLDGVVISGGEPTIHKDLPLFIGKIRNLGYKIKLDTNGTNPEMVKDLIRNGLVDFIAMDIKTIPEAEEYARVTNCRSDVLVEKIRETIVLLRTSGIECQFRTTVLPHFHTGEIISALEQEFRNDVFVKQIFREGITLDSYLPGEQTEISGL